MNAKTIHIQTQLNPKWVVTWKCALYECFHVYLCASRQQQRSTIDFFPFFDIDSTSLCCIQYWVVNPKYKTTNFHFRRLYFHRSPFCFFSILLSICIQVHVHIFEFNQSSLKLAYGCISGWVPLENIHKAHCHCWIVVVDGRTVALMLW